jgi:hypothetical protein
MNLPNTELGNMEDLCEKFSLQGTSISKFYGKEKSDFGELRVSQSVRQRYIRKSNFVQRKGNRSPVRN